MVIVYLFGFGISVFLLFKKREWKRAALILLAGSLLSIFLWCAEHGDSEKEVRSIPRSVKSGREKLYLLDADMDGQKKEISLNVSPQAYTKKELEERLILLEGELEKRILGENESLEHITEDLVFMEVLEDFPFQLTWSTDCPSLLSETGKIGGEILKEGELVEITVHISNERSRFEACHIFYGRVYPSDSYEAGFQRLEKALAAEEKKYLQEETYRLPQEFEGKRVFFTKKQETKSSRIFFLALISLALLAAEGRREKEKLEKKRRDLIEKEYPALVSRTAMLIGAGMTISGAFRRIVLEYEKNREEKRSVLYEELVTAYHEMEAGISEREAYKNLGARCRFAGISRFTALLIQYTKSGAAGLQKALKEETAQALRERRERAKKLGEEAGTKLLLPMTLMLIVVMIMIIIPAFSSFHF